MSDTRRERYYTAANKAMDWRYGNLGPVVDAAMAVADEEIAEWREEYTALRSRYDKLLTDIPLLNALISEIATESANRGAENGRLRTELDELTGVNGELRRQEVHRLAAENARLRAEQGESGESGGSQCPVPLTTPCAGCLHTRNWHLVFNSMCIVDNCACGHFSPGGETND